MYNSAWSSRRWGTPRVGYHDASRNHQVLCFVVTEPKAKKAGGEGVAPYRTVPIRGRDDGPLPCALCRSMYADRMALK